MAEYINRDDALSHPFANGRYDHKNANEDFILGFESYKEWLETLPIADVRENVRGEWIYDGEYDEYADNIWKCSNCGHTWNFIGGYLSHPLDYDANYCPNCGAEMRGEK